MKLPKHLSFHGLNFSPIKHLTNMQSRPRKRWQRQLAPLLALTIAIASFGHGMAIAAERLRIRFGPLETTLEIDDLERFARTGKASGDLELIEPFLIPEIRELLLRRVDIDPEIADDAIDLLLESSAGQRWIQMVLLMIPDSTVEQVKAAIKLAIRQAEGLSLIGILKALPGETITLDATAAIAAASRLNLPYLEAQILRSRLESDLETESDGPFIAPFDPALPGSDPVRETTLTLADRQRDRDIPVDLYIPDDPKSPLVVMSPGLGGDRSFLTYLARHLASHGFPVVAVEHPRSNRASLSDRPVSLDLGQLMPPSEFLDRPQDIRFVLDRLASGDGDLRVPLDTDNVVAIGHSLGGYTVLALAGAELRLDDLREVCGDTPEASRSYRQWLGKAPADLLQCTATQLSGNRKNLRDRRIQGAIALNPVVGELFGDKGLDRLDTPVAIVAATEDGWAPAVTHQLRPFLDLPEPKYLITAIGASHFSATDPDNPDVLDPESASSRERDSLESENYRQLLRGASLAFVAQFTPEANAYRPFLTGAYAQSLSTPTVPLRLNREIPKRLARWLESTRAEITRRD
jgi:predicted dienelactone hydrolase